MPKTRKQPSTASMPVGAQRTNALPWVDAYVRLVEGWFDWQCAVWQPLIDAQAECIRQWQDQSGWPWADVVSLRGAEQLA
jgi:hypothetical protein